MKSLAVIIPFYKRKEITSLCFKHLVKQQKKFGFTVFVSGDDKSIVPKSFKFIECENNPLGNKLNTLLQATKQFEAVTVFGSDDFVSDSVFELFNTLDLSKEVYYGFDNIHIYSSHHNKLGTDCAYVQSGNTIGVARLWTKSTLVRMNYQLWTDDKNNGLDGDSKRRMLSKGIKEISMSYIGHFMVDVKQDYNITSPNLVNTCDTIEDKNIIVSELGNIGNEILNLLPGETKQIKRVVKMKESKRELVKIETIEDFSGMKKGTIKEIPLPLANKLVKRKLVKIVTSEKKKPTEPTTKVVKEVEAPKKTTRKRTTKK